MRVAIVNPYPVRRGGVGGISRVASMAAHLAAHGHAVTVLAHASGDAAADAAAERDLAAVGVAQRLFPLPARGPRARLAWLTDGTPYFVGYNRNPGLEEALGALARDTARGGLDVVHVEFAYLFPALAAAGGAVRVLAEQETMSLAVDRLDAVPLRARSAFEHYLRADRRRIEGFERRVLPRFDLRYAITAAEATHMRRLSGGPVRVLPHVVDPRAFTPPTQEPDAPAVLFVGSYHHRPNLHGVHWLAEQVWPRVLAAVPNARLELVGPGMPDADRRRLEGVPGLGVAGWVDDLVARYHAAAACVNPVHTGGGMRGKVLEAFACGRAVVSTSMGLEGVDDDGAAGGQPPWLAADAPDAFAAALVRYLRDPALRRAHGARARALVARRYDPAVVFARLEADYAAAVAARQRKMTA